MLTGPKWKGAFYIDDERASNEQSDLLAKIFSGQRRFFCWSEVNLIGEVLGIKSAPIEFGIDGKRRWLHIKDC